MLMNKSNKNKIGSIAEQTKPKVPSEASAIYAGDLVVKGRVSKFEKRNRLSLTQDRYERGQSDGHLDDSVKNNYRQERRIAKLTTRTQLLEAANDLLFNGGYPELANIRPDTMEYEGEEWFDGQRSFVSSEYLYPEDTIKIAVSHDDDIVGQAIVVRRLQSKNRKGIDPVSYYEGPYPDQDVVTDIIH